MDRILSILLGGVALIVGIFLSVVSLGYERP